MVGQDRQVSGDGLLAFLQGFDLQLCEADEPPVALFCAGLLAAQHEHHPLGVFPG
jgi:hypothetical protein